MNQRRAPRSRPLYALATLLGVFAIASPVYPARSSHSRQTVLIDARPPETPPTADRFYITFVAQPRERGVSKFGHTFVIWGKNDFAARDIPLEGFGYNPRHPKEKAHLIGDVRADVIREDIDHLVPHGTRFLVVEVDQPTYNATLALKDEIKQAAHTNAQNYLLTKENCNNFAGVVAEKVGLRTPTESGVFPVNYLQRLIDTNTDKLHETYKRTFPKFSTDNRLRIPGAEIKYVTPQAARQFYQALLEAEDHPDMQLDVVIRPYEDTIAEVRVRYTKVTAEPQLQRGDELSVFVPGQVSAQGRQDISAAVRSMTKWPTTKPNVVRESLEREPESPLFGSPSTWVTTPLAANATYLFLAGRGLQSLLAGPDDVVPLLQMTRPDLVGAPSDRLIGPPVMPPKTSADWRELTRREQVWRRYRQFMSAIKSAYRRALLDAWYSKFSLREIAHRQAQSQRALTESAKQFTFRAEMHARQRAWEQYQRRKLLDIAQEQQAEANRDGEAMKPIIARNVEVNRVMRGIAQDIPRQLKAMDDWYRSIAPGLDPDKVQNIGVGSTATIAPAKEPQASATGPSDVAHPGSILLTVPVEPFVEVPRNAPVIEIPPP